MSARWTEEAMAAALTARNEDAQILGVFDITNKTVAGIDSRRLGEAIQFVANAAILGYDVRAAVVMYGEPGTPSLRVTDCERLWARYGESLLR
ncbi:hypothetical protein B5V02_27600 [Mesorhizobium kowhaii]|uniref:Uncharacterized protein n=1 Tax=Mesorhizobium kowhaii TaxID=1300272 RepID=A0A2W7BWZ5_9HYPH|nr:hypothetical protein B5V02_27600 [Mesorhizobium kowhaii]